MTLRFKCNVDNEYHGHDNPLKLQDVLTSVTGMNLGAMFEAGASDEEITRHINVMGAISRTLLLKKRS